MAIMQSYDFTINLIRKHGLAAHFSGMPKSLLGWPFRKKQTDWQLYQRFTELFDAEFDSDKGNLVLTFIDPSLQWPVTF